MAARADKPLKNRRLPIGNLAIAATPCAAFLSKILICLR
jgi:hypothetical protein